MITAKDIDFDIKDVESETKHNGKDLITKRTARYRVAGITHWYEEEFVDGAFPQGMGINTIINRIVKEHNESLKEKVV